MKNFDAGEYNSDIKITYSYPNGEEMNDAEVSIPVQIRVGNVEKVKETEKKKAVGSYSIVSLAFVVLTTLISLITVLFAIIRGTKSRKNIIAKKQGGSVAGKLLTLPFAAGSIALFFYVTTGFGKMIITDSWTGYFVAIFAGLIALLSWIRK
jgi:hypothetical protein